MTTHVGTHIDALGHASSGELLYNGLRAADVLDDFGLTELGVEHVPPMITRGVNLDLSSLDGEAFLDAGRAVGVDDLERAQDSAPDIDSSRRRRGVPAHRLGTHWFMRDNDRYVAGEPGIDEHAARWLTERGVVAIAADNMAVEVVPNPAHPRLILPVHQHALAEAGVYLIENLKLDDTQRIRHFRVLFHLAGDQVQGCHRLPRATRGDGVSRGLIGPGVCAALDEVLRHRLLALCLLVAFAEPGQSPGHSRKCGPRGNPGDPRPARFFWKLSSRALDSTHGEPE